MSSRQARRPDVATADIVGMYESGRSMVQIAAAVGMSDVSVAYRLRAAGVVLRPPRHRGKTRTEFHADPSDPRHGTYNGYNNLKCRCPRCRVANADTVARRRALLRAEGLATDDHRHGTLNGYGNWGCRCQRCTAAMAAAEGSRRARRRVQSDPQLSPDAARSLP